MTEPLKEPQRSIARHRFLIGTLVFVCAVTFFVLAAAVQSGDALERDRSVMHSLAELHTPVLIDIFRAITYTASEIVVASLILASLWLWRQGRKREMVLLLLSWAVFTLLIINGLKAVFQRPRPDVFDYLVRQSGYSFPSGHAGAAISLFGLLGIFFWGSGNRLVALLCWFWVIFVAFSRVYLGVHYPSDVLASLSLGVIWLVFIIVIGNRVMARRSSGSG